MRVTDVSHLAFPSLRWEMPCQHLNNLCMANGSGYRCTRPAGHGGRHAAAGFRHVIAVWPVEEADR